MDKKRGNLMEMFLYKNSKKLFAFALIILGILFSLAPISATFSMGIQNYSVIKMYGPSFNISGWINISFNNEPASSVFTDSFGNSITLEKMLNLTPSYNKTCVPLDCGKDYSASNEATTKVFNMGAADSKIFGLKFTGNVSYINSVSFDAQSNAAASCLSQLKIDILNDGLIDFQNNKSEIGGTECPPRDYGCFDAALAKDTYALSSGTTYCQKINLTESPAIRVGAWIKKNSGSLNVKIGIYDTRGNSKGICNLPEINAEGEYYCDINYSVIKPAEYYICIYPGTGTGDYRITGNTAPTKVCGFPNLPLQRETAAYQIFAVGKQFTNFGTVSISNKLSEDTFAEKVQDYLVQKYGMKSGKIDCSLGCVVPIGFKSSTTQTVTLQNLKAHYTKDAGETINENFYDLAETSPRISSSFSKLYLDKGAFAVSNTIGNYTFSLKFNNEEVVYSNIEVTNVPIINFLTPLSTASVYPTEFFVNISVPENVSITSYSWNFGNGSSFTTNMNKSTHTYPAVGIYELTVSVTDSRGFSSSRIFEINVTSPKQLINVLLNDTNNSLENLKAEIQNFQQAFYRTGINEVLNMANISSELKTLSVKYENATTDAEYNNILTEILKIKIPNSVFKTQQAPSFALVPDKNYVDLDVLKTIGEGNYSSLKIDDYKNAVIAWQSNNVNLILNFNEFSGNYDSHIEPIVRIFEIDIDKKNSSIDYDYYLIMPESKNMGFDREVKRADGFVYINLKDNSKFSFYTTEDLKFTDIPIFVSPAIDKLSLTTKPLPPTKSKLFLLVLIMVGLLFISAIVYVVLQQWYKRKYENYLFKNRNDLYNLAIYVNSAKRKGVSNAQIKEHLRKAKWTPEQIRYIMRKYEGKNTGMFEIPAEKWANKLKHDERQGYNRSSGRNIRRF